jgi:hypothetical protein
MVVASHARGLESRQGSRTRVQFEPEGKVVKISAAIGGVIGIAAVSRLRAPQIPPAKMA